MAVMEDDREISPDGKQSRKSKAMLRLQYRACRRDWVGLDAFGPQEGLPPAGG